MGRTKPLGVYGERLKELWGMEQAGVKFSDADLLAMFGR